MILRHLLAWVTTKLAPCARCNCGMPTSLRMRLIKEPAEIDLMRQAAALVRIGVMATLAAAAPGQSQLTIESVGTNAILEAAAQVTPEATVNLLHFTTSGPETSLPHLITTTRHLT